MVSPQTSTADIAARSVLAEMARQKVSQVDLAALTLIPRVTLQRRLASGDFTLDELDRIAQALHVEVDELLKGRAA